MTGTHIESLKLWKTLEEHDGGGSWGFVHEYQSIGKVIKEYEKLTVSQYVIDYNTIMYKSQKNMDVFHKKIRFDDFGDNKIPNDGTPFIIGGSIRYSCQRGNDRHAFSKSKYKSTREELAKVNPDGVRMYKKRKEGSKVGCASRIYIKKVILFPHHKVSDLTSYKRMKITRAIKKSVSDGERGGMIIRYYIKLPLNSTHTNHQLGEDSMIKRLDKRLMHEVRKLVRRDVQSANKIRAHLQEFVEQKVRPLPSKTDSAYYPSLNIVRGHMNRAQRTLKMAMYDPEGIDILMRSWQSAHPDDNYYMRSTKQEVATDENDLFLLVYQSKYQRHLLQRYGQAVVLNPVHRLIKYGLPFFFIEVRTNAGFAVIGSFVCHSESSGVIAEAMQKICEWNPAWIPQYFLTDVVASDVQGLQLVFPGCCMFYSDYHRELSWNSWLKNKANGINEHADDILSHLRKLASCPSEQQFNSSVTILNQTSVWQESHKLRKWLNSQWLVVHMKWVWYFRKHCGIMINTWDIDKLGQIFKIKYLKHKWSTSVSDMIKNMIQTFLPKQIRRYVMENQVPASSNYNQPVIPDFLQNRPNGFVVACLTNITQAERMQYTDVFAMDFTTNTYKVQSTTNTYMTYTVTIDPFECECTEWQRTYIPCKHLFAVLLYTPFSWQHISCKYKESCYTTIDYVILDYAIKDSSLNQTSADLEDDNIVAYEDTCQDKSFYEEDEGDSDNDKETVIMDDSEFISEVRNSSVSVSMLTNVRGVLRQCAEVMQQCGEMTEQCMGNQSITCDTEGCQRIQTMANQLLEMGLQFQETMRQTSLPAVETEKASTKLKRPAKLIKQQSKKHDQIFNVFDGTPPKTRSQKTVPAIPMATHNILPQKHPLVQNKNYPADQPLVEYPWDQQWESLMH